MTETVKRYTCEIPIVDSSGQALTSEEMQVVLATDYARLEQACERLRGLLSESLKIIDRCNVDAGVCLCGVEVERHGFGGGHSPVDEGAYRALLVIQRIEKAMRAKP